ncbi:MAG: hypothetical protein ABIR27_04320 [Dokdonella sp.]
MSDVRFEWIPAKAASNLKKHGIGFDEARSDLPTSAPNSLLIHSIQGQKIDSFFSA